MKRKIVLSLLVFVLAIMAAVPAFAKGGRNTPNSPVIFVTGQDLYYDTIVLGELPQKGRFQLLEMDGPTGLQTEFGHGDQGYVGGRWWVDANGNGEMDSEDAFFLCPLLGPGRTEP